MAMPCEETIHQPKATSCHFITIIEGRGAIDGDKETDALYVHTQKSFLTYANWTKDPCEPNLDTPE